MSLLLFGFLKLNCDIRVVMPNYLRIVCNGERALSIGVSLYSIYGYERIILFWHLMATCVINFVV